MPATGLPWATATRATAVVLLLASGLLILEGPVAGLALGFALTRTALLMGGRLRHAGEVTVFVAIAAFIGWIASYSSDRVWLSGTVLALAVLGAVVSAALNPHYGPLTGVLTVWTVLALSFGGVRLDIWAIGGFVVGALFAAADSRVLNRPDPPLSKEGPEPGRPPFAFALFLAVVVFVAVGIGFAAFPDFPYWVAITVIVVLAVRVDLVKKRILERSIGTLLGVLVGLSWVGLGPQSDVWLLAGLIVMLFLQFLFLDRNYVLFAMFLTAVIILGSAASGLDVTTSALARFGATILGGVMAGLGLAAGLWISRSDAGRS